MRWDWNWKGESSIKYFCQCIQDIARYNAADNCEEAQEEFGWKLVHG